MIYLRKNGNWSPLPMSLGLLDKRTVVIISLQLDRCLIDHPLQVARKQLISP